MIIIKQQVVMHKVSRPPGRVVFSEILDDGDKGRCRHTEMLVGDYLDMGEPKVITVTIEPGDLLNE